MRWHREHLIQFLEGLALGLGQEQQHEPKADDVPGRVPAERALRLERREKRRPRHGQDEVEEPGRGGGEGHAHVADVQRVRFGRVRERHRALAGRVHDTEEVRAQRDAPDTGAHVRGWDPETEAGEKKGDGHERKRGEEEIAPAERVDGVDGRDGEEEVDYAPAHGCAERGHFGEARVFEDTAAVVGDDVDAAELLIVRETRCEE